MPNIVNNYSSTIITIYQDVIKTYENNQKTIKEIEEELNDVNHEIELSAPKDMYKGYLMYKTVRELRQHRRQCKDENALLKDMYEFLKGQQGQQFKSKIQQIQGGSSKVYESQERRTYVPRQRSDLTITGQTCVANKPFEELLKDFNAIKISIKNGKLRK